MEGVHVQVHGFLTAPPAPGPSICHQLPCASPDTGKPQNKPKKKQGQTAEKKKNLQVGKERAVFQHPHKHCVTVLGEANRRWGNCLGQYWSIKRHPTAPMARSNEHLTAGHLTKPMLVPMTMDWEQHIRLGSRWTNALSLCKSSKTQAWLLPPPSPSIPFPHNLLPGLEQSLCYQAVKHTKAELV